MLRQFSMAAASASDAVAAPSDCVEHDGHLVWADPEVSAPALILSEVYASYGALVGRRVLVSRLRKKPGTD